MISFSILVQGAEGGFLSVACEGPDALYLFNGQLDWTSGATAARDFIKEKMDWAIARDEWQMAVERYVDVNGEPVYRMFNTMFS
jgi:hypothetical protein